MTEKPCEIQCFDKGVDLESKFGGWVRTHLAVVISPEYVFILNFVDTCARGLYLEVYFRASITSRFLSRSFFPPDRDS